MGPFESLASTLPHELPTADDREDDARLAQMVGEYLGQSGLQVTHRADGKVAWRSCGPDAEPLPDLVILDLMLPDMDGLEVCRRIRSLQGNAAQVPVLMLTAKGDPWTASSGWSWAPTTTCPSPFEPRELLARIRAILRRRTDGGGGQPPPRCCVSALEIDRDARTVTVAGQAADLTSYQFDLLVALAERAGRVLTATRSEAVRGRELEAFDRIDVHMGRIRAAIEQDAKNPRRILTVRGVGYVFAKQQD